MCCWTRGVGVSTGGGSRTSTVSSLRCHATEPQQCLQQPFSEEEANLRRHEARQKQLIVDKILC